MLSALSLRHLQHAAAFGNDPPPLVFEGFDMKSDDPKASEETRARARDRFRWLEAINRSPDLSPVQRAVAISIGLRFNVTCGRCDPGYDAIAEGTPYRRRAVISAVANLAAKVGLLSSRAAAGIATIST